jgi:hypothetical protein
LIKDRDALLVFYDFPAEHWKHLRTTNVIESSFEHGAIQGMSLEQDRAHCQPTRFAGLGGVASSPH